LLALAVVLLVCAAFAIAGVLELTWTGTVLAAFVIAFAQIVLMTEVLSLFHAVHPATYLLGDTLIAAIGVAWWVRRGRPRPVASLPGWTTLKRHPLLLALGAVVAVGLVVELALALVAVPNNFDSMTYHLSRAAAWYQQDAYGHLHAHTARQNAYPPNAEMLTLFTMVFSHGDRFTALPQYVSELALLVAIFGIARRVGFRRSEAAFASLIFATMSEIVLEATSTQNDLVVTACVVIAAYFVLGRTLRECSLAGLALGLALGTKFSGIWAFPVVALIALGALPRRQVVRFAAATALAFVFLASPVYAANLKY
jgi:Dolichyl-phosphate-mannose-protein mannosyltransferase